MHARLEHSVPNATLENLCSFPARVKRVCRLFATFPRLDFEKKRILLGDLCSLVRVDRVGEGGGGEEKEGREGKEEENGKEARGKWRVCL